MKVAFGPFTFDSDARELVAAGVGGAGERAAGDTRVHLSPKAFELLHYLLVRRPAVVTKRELLEHLWPGTYVSEANLTVVVSEVRQALGDDSRQWRFIRTVHRVGYAFGGEVAEVAAAEAAAASARVASGEAASGDLGPVPLSEAAALCWLTHGGRSFPLVAGENVVGRDPRCAVWVDASGVSRRHALIVVSAGGATIEDLGSSNGTFVEGERVSGRRRLADGEVIELGAARLDFHAWSDEEAPRTERIEGR